MEASFEPGYSSVLPYSVNSMSSLGGVNISSANIIPGLHFKRPRLPGHPNANYKVLLFLIGCYVFNLIM